jgi:signal transduction histidine kinase
MAVSCAAATVIGDVLHGRRTVTEALTREQNRRWLAEERARIARELHDVVAHHMSMITVQAETARYRLSGLPAPAVDEFTGIARLARGSLTELRTLLSALRDEDDPAYHAPQPDLGGLAELVERTAATGTTVRLAVRPDPAALRELPTAVQLSAYRIVQEALSNVVRHARGATGTVDVELSGGALRIEIVNDRPPPQPGPVEPARPGHGLVGLRERASLLGGTLEVDAPGGGWRVRAVLPLGANR